MTQEFKDSLEEAFVEKNFLMSDELEDIKVNLAKAEELFNQASAQIDNFLTIVKNKGAWDDSTMILALQMMSFADYYRKKFANDLKEI